MIDEKKLIAEMRERQEYWKGKAAEYEEVNREWLSAIADGIATEYTETLLMVENQPKVGEWTPCNEKLPDDEAKQYICDVFGGKGSLYPCLLTYQSPNNERIHVVRFYYDIDEQCFVNHAGSLCEKKRCLAWQPLPEPWRGENK